jgi:hypothetical protein
LFWGCEEFFRRKVGGFAGSYPFAEYWELKATEAEVIEAIVELKKEQPDLQPPGQKEFFRPRKVEYDCESDAMKPYWLLLLKDSTVQLPPMTEFNSKPSDYWLYIDFYYSDSKEIVHAWTRPSLDTMLTTFAFVSLSRLNKFTDRRLINRDFWYIANKIEISKFKSTFVDKIEEKINNKRKKGT